MSTTPRPTARPYTSYNFFFQLEREYILQTLLGFEPTVAPQDVFDPSQGNYAGPPLPPRYANLILPNDWHIPGKTSRRKRLHRKSHGKVGFHEMNDKISKAWQAADGEVRAFCEALQSILSSEFPKKQKKTTARRRRRGKGKKSAAKSIKDEVDIGTEDEVMGNLIDWPIVGSSEYDDRLALTDWTDSSLLLLPPLPAAAVVSPCMSLFLPLPRLLLLAVVSPCMSPEMYQVEETMVVRKQFTRMVSFNQKDIQDTTATTRHRAESVIAQVDMNDDEIISMWNSTVEEAPLPALPPPVMEDIPMQDIPSDPSPTDDDQQLCMEITPSASPVEGEGGDTSNNRMSFIDAEYEKFLKLGEQYQFVNKQRLPRKIARKSMFSTAA